MIQAVIFDLWGTLIYDDPAVSERRNQFRLEWSREALAELGHDYDLADITAAFLAAGAELARVHDREIDLSARGRTVLYLRHLDPSLGGRLGADDWSRLDEAILTPALTHRPPLLPGAADVLSALRALGLRAALISNAGITPGFVLRQLLDDIGLGQHFDLTVFSDEVALSKPSSAIFNHTLDELGLTPEQAVFVGDQPLLDVVGARRAGMWMVQIGDLPTDGEAPHAQIASLDELVPALRSLALID